MSTVLGVPSENPALSSQSFSAPQVNTDILAYAGYYAKQNMEPFLESAKAVYNATDLLRRTTEQAYAQKALNEYRQGVNQKLAELSNLHGEDFIKAYKTFDSEVDKLRENISSTYDDEVIQNTFAISALPITESVKKEASARNIKAVYDFKLNQLNASISENANEMMMNFNDPVKRKESIAKIRKGLALSCDMQGIPAGSEQAKQLERQTLNEGFYSAINYQIETKSFDAAHASLNSLKKDMEGSTYLRLKARLLNAEELEARRLQVERQVKKEKIKELKLGRVLTPDEEQLIFDKHLKQQIELLKKTNPKLNNNEIYNMAYKPAQLGALREIEASNAQYSQKAKAKLEVTAEGVQFIRDNIDLVASSVKTPFELQSETSQQLILQTYDSPEEYNKEVMKQVNLGGNENAFNALMNGNPKSVLSTLTSPENAYSYCKSQGFNLVQTQKVLKKYEEVQQDPFYKKISDSQVAMFAMATRKGDTADIVKKARSDLATQHEIISVNAEIEKDKSILLQTHHNLKEGTPEFNQKFQMMIWKNSQKYKALGEQAKEQYQDLNSAVFDSPVLDQAIAEATQANGGHTPTEEQIEFYIEKLEDEYFTGSAEFVGLPLHGDLGSFGTSLYLK